jgi:ribonuclease BN (tRNA processing enzyme)
MHATAEPLIRQERVRVLPNNIVVVTTAAGDVLVNSPPETIKFLLAAGFSIPTTILLPPDVPPGQQVGSSGFVRQGVSYASVEFPIYFNFFVKGGQRTRLITVTNHQAQRLRQILVETISGPTEPELFGNSYWLRDECDAISVYPPLGRALRVDDMVDIVSLESGGGNLGATTIRYQDGMFVFSENDLDMLALSPHLTQPPMPPTLTPPRPLQRQELTLQFVGGSHGFDPAGITTCFLAYLDSSTQQAVLFDAAAYLLARLGSMGLSANQISAVFLSHLHEDHLAGLPELILLGGKRVRLLTADLVYRGLLRVLSAMLAVSEADVAALFDYIPLNPHQRVNVGGLEYETMYAVHSIPTLAVHVKGLCYSGDMRYDEEWFENLVVNGTLSNERRNELISFADNAALLVQDVGGGTIHTTLTPAVLEALAAKSRRLVLAHTSSHNLPTDRADLIAQVEFAKSGHVVAVGETVTTSPFADIIETLAANPLFARLTVAERARLAEQADLSVWANGEQVRFEDGFKTEPLIVHSGLVEVRIDGRLAHVLGRGSDVTAYSAIQIDSAQSVLTARGDVRLLHLRQHVFEPVAIQLGLHEAIERARWLSHSPIFADTPWSNLIDLALDFQPRCYNIGDQLFQYGDLGVESFLLVEGSVAISNADNQQINVLDQPGTFFGGRAALYGKLRNASAHATSLTEVWALPVIALRRFHLSYPSLVLHLRAAEAQLSAPPTINDSNS